MPPDTIQPIQDILNRWILIGQALVGSIGALAFVVAFLWTKIGRFKARTNAPSIDAGQDDQVGRQTPETSPLVTSLSCLKRKNRRTSRGWARARFAAR